MLCIPNFEVTKLSDDSKCNILDLNESGNKNIVIDFWHTKCTRCPAALEKLNKLSILGDMSDIIFVACALSQGDGNEELVKDMIDEWEDLTHVFVSTEVKEQLKKVLYFASVPFSIVVDKDGTVLASGDPKSIDFAAYKSPQASENINISNTSKPALTIDEDF